MERLAVEVEQHFKNISESKTEGSSLQGTLEFIPREEKKWEEMSGFILFPKASVDFEKEYEFLDFLVCILLE